ncbi:unnamed protein product, partial [Xyrichtys novacula]
SHYVGFVSNFDVFLERRHLFGSDRLHLNRVGACMLSANLAHGVQHANLPIPAPIHSVPPLTTIHTTPDLDYIFTPTHHPFP